ncbi:MAG: hypothetical protein HRU46_05575 [Verrucomicrobiales bacterium]|nr:hypothetical protein [Verrucomicrobiales bacterium]
MKSFLLISIVLGGVTVSACKVRTVKDSHGDIIYQEPERVTPFKSDAEKMEAVFEKENALGYY